MRLTIKLDAFDHAAETAFAVLWIDRERGRWSREGHDRVELPAWGTWEAAPDGTVLRDPHTSAPLMKLRGLALEAGSGAAGAPGETQQGRTEFLASRDASATALRDGHWHIQCVDCESTIAEHEVFSDEDNILRWSGSI